MAQVSLELPEKVYSVLHCSPDELDKELRLAASAHWYQQGRISQEWAAKIAGMDRTDFLLALARMGKDSFVVDFEDLDKELARG
jgi:predicted HTH domain antitoxin